jgi:hypothetical protein
MDDREKEGNKREEDYSIERIRPTTFVDELEHAKEDALVCEE